MAILSSKVPVMYVKSVTRQNFRYLDQIENFSDQNPAWFETVCEKPTSKVQAVNRIGTLSHLPTL